MAAPIAATSVVTPVEVSLCTTMTARIRCSVSASSAATTAPAVSPSRGFHGSCRTSIPKRFATFTQPWAKKPCSKARTESPADRVFAIAASQAPLPDAGEMKTSCSVRNTRLIPSSSCGTSSAKAGPRWSMVARDIARSTRAGVFVGPGS